MFNLSLRKRFRRPGQRDVHSDETGIKRGNTATEVADSQAVDDQAEVRTQGQENSVVGDGSNPQGESVEAVVPIEAATPSKCETPSHVQEKPAAVSWSQYYAEHRDEILEGFRTFFSIGETITGAIPLPGSDIVFGALTSFVERVQIVGENTDARKELLDRLSNLKIEGDLNLWPERSVSALKTFESQIVEQLHPYLKRIEQRGQFTKIFLAEADKEKLEAFDTCIMKAINDFSAVLLAGNTTTLGQVTNTTARIKDGVNAVGDKVDAHFDAQDLQKVVDQLPKQATYGSIRTRELIECHPRTCEKILEEIKIWALADVEDPQPQLLWLSGLAGTGKSTIATSIATWADKEEHILGSNYFFSRDIPELKLSSLVIPTIAHHISEHLSEHVPSSSQHIRKRLSKTNILTQKIAQQFESLIEEPLRLPYDPGAFQKRMLLVIDGLDECSDEPESNAIEKIIQSLLKFLLISYSNIRILLVSRPEKSIENALDVSNRLSIVRKKVEGFVDEKDVEEYLRQEFKNIGEESWPSEVDFDSLARRCGKLFIYAKTAVNFIRPGNESAYGDCDENLQGLLKMYSSEVFVGTPYKQLDELYLQILVEAVKRTPQAKQDKKEQFCRILGAIALSREPLGVRSLAKLIGVGEKRIQFVLSFLGSVIIVPPEKDLDKPVQFFHPSMPDFITNAERCKDERFFIDVPHIEGILFQGCKETIVSTGLSGQVDEKYFPVLEYACVNWGYHLEKARHEDATVVEALENFVEHHILKWHKFARVFLAYTITEDKILPCLEIARNWALKRENLDWFKELSKRLDSVVQSPRKLASCMFIDNEGMYDAARSKSGKLHRTRRTPCHPGTRQGILNEIKKWITNPRSKKPNVFWLRGNDLTGKSAIAMSLANWANERGIPCVAYLPRDNTDFWFFCSTIAFDIASLDHETRNIVIRSLKQYDNVPEKDNKTTFEGHIAKPLLSGRRVPILLIIDGLEKLHEADEVVTLSLKLLSGPDNSHIRIVMTSNSRTDELNLSSVRIRGAFERKRGFYVSKDLDEIPDDDVRQDIKMYLCAGLTRIHETFEMSPPSHWLNPSVLDSLVNESRNSFFCAKCALEFIGNPNVRNPATQLETWLEKRLDDNSFKDMYHHWIAELIASPVGLEFFAICVAPKGKTSESLLSVGSLAQLFGLDVNIMKSTLRHLYPFIVFDVADCLSARYSSLRTFCMTSELAVRRRIELCLRCLKMMEELSVAIGGAGRSDRADWTEKSFSPGIQYASRYWTAFLSNLKKRDLHHGFERALKAFIQNHLFDWFFVMALLQLTSDLVSSMCTALEWFHIYYITSKEDDSAHTRILLEEAWHFVEDNQQAFANKPLQVYCAALDLPEDSVLSRTYKASAEERLRIFEETNRTPRW